jgi:hypothetical protein
MAALVQTIPQSSTVPVLQTRPSSSSGTFSTPQNQHIQSMSWTTFNGNSGNYRAGHPVAAPYAYNPNLGQAAQNRQSWAPHLRPEHRTFSAPTSPQLPGNQAYATPRNPHTAAGSVSNSSSSNSSFRSHVSKDDSALPTRQPRSDQPLRPLSTANLPPPSVMNINSPKPSPNRYRRANQRAEAAASTSTPAPVPTVVVDDHSTPTVPRPSMHNRVASVDDASHSERTQPERYRRRSVGNMDSSAHPNLHLDLQSPASTPAPGPASGPYDFIAFDTNQRPVSSHSHRESLGSNHSAKSSTSSVGIPARCECKQTN